MSLSRLRRHLAGNVVAYVALFVALGGGAYAAVKVGKNTVKSKSIKDGQVKTKDLGKDAVVTGKVKDGSLLDADFASGQIPPAGLSGYEERLQAGPSDSEDSKSMPSRCNDNKVVIGGGGYVLGDGADSVAIDVSAPIQDLNHPIAYKGGWFVSAHEHDLTTDDWQLIVYAICVDEGS
jgi:hypothetical protein